MIQGGPGMLRQVASIVYLQTPAWGGWGGVERDARSVCLRYSSGVS